MHWFVNYSDAFTKREKANEDYAIRMREKEKLLELRKRLAEQHEHLKKLEEHMWDHTTLIHLFVASADEPVADEHVSCSDEISKSQGGEQK